LLLLRRKKSVHARFQRLERNGIEGNQKTPPSCPEPKIATGNTDLLGPRIPLSVPAAIDRAVEEERQDVEDDVHAADADEDAVASSVCDCK
jgi:hypothetical protein